MDITHRVKVIKEPKKLWINISETPGERIRKNVFRSKFDMKVFALNKR